MILTKRISNKYAYIAYLTTALFICTIGVVRAGTEIGSFTSPLSISLGGTGLTSTPTDGQLQIGKTSTNNYVLSTITQGTGITVTNGSGSITIAANGGGNRTVTAKTSNYTVLSGDSGTVFTNTGAGGTVVLTLPTAAAGLTYTAYVDAGQTVQFTAGASTTIRLGGTASASAGNITNNVAGGCVTLVAISTTQWIAIGYTGTWTVT